MTEEATGRAPATAASDGSTSPVSSTVSASASSTASAKGESGRTLPNLFVIGAMKSGTSSFHELLNQHPEIFMSRFKEPQYFAPHHRLGHGMWGEGNPLPEPGIDWYLRLFAEAGDAWYAGESSTTYTKAPTYTGCAERIARFNPDARLIYLLRDPIRRARSHYFYRVADLHEARSMLHAFQADAQYLAYSNYHMQMEPYVEHFGLGRIHVVVFEELLADPLGVMNRLYDWLGVAPLTEAPVVPRENTTVTHVGRLRGGLQWYVGAKEHWRWRRLQKRMPARLKALAKRLATRPIDTKRHEDPEA